MKDLKIIYIAACIVHGIDIKNPVQKRVFFWGRASFFNAARKIEPQPSLASLGNYMNGKNHASVIHGLKKYDHYMLDPVFKRLDNAVQVKIIELKEKYKDTSLVQLDQDHDIGNEDIVTKAVQTSLELDKVLAENEVLMQEVQSLHAERNMTFDQFLFDIMKQPEHIRQELCETRWIPFQKMLESRKQHAA